MKKDIELPQVKEVQLPEFLGMRPGIYIVTLLLLAAIAIIFLVCFLPGVLKGGRYVNFSSPLAQSGVIIDGTYLGGTPYQFFVSSGEHEVTFTKAGVPIDETTLKVDHPVFLTWLFHRTQESRADIENLSSEKKYQINEFNLQKIIEYSAITEFDAVHPYPPLFTTLVNDGLAMGLDREKLLDSFALASNFITSSFMLSDALEANEMLDRTKPLLEETLSIAQRLFSDERADMVGLEAADKAVQGKRVILQEGEFVQEGFSYPASFFTMGSQVPSIFPETNKAGVNAETESFSIASTPVSQYQWALFIEENPQWDKTEIETLQENNLTDEFYLSGILPSVVFATGKPVHNISYKAATAFCKWLTEKTGKEVFIPTEEMWSLAAMQATEKSFARSLTITDTEGTSPSAMLGGVWEFTSSPYIPLQRVTDYQKVATLYQATSLSTDMIVKGGSYLNTPSSIDVHTVGAVDTTSCGDLIGFRIAWKN